MGVRRGLGRRHLPVRRGGAAAVRQGERGAVLQGAQGGGGGAGAAPLGPRAPARPGAVRALAPRGPRPPRAGSSAAV